MSAAAAVLVLLLARPTAVGTTKWWQADGCGTDEPCCDWFGVVCSEQGGLPYLEELTLSSNKFSGTIPLSIVDAPQLRFLNLAENQFQGNLPATVAAMENSEELHLEDNILLTGIDVEMERPIKLGRQCSFQRCGWIYMPSAGVG